MASINDNSALLLYRVGPVLCCAPCLPVSTIIEPPPLTRTPGSRPGHPGIFKHAQAIVTALDLRHQFGLDESQWANPGRTIVTTLDTRHVGFHVDEILDVISMPTTGWGTLPAMLPRGIFTRTLLHKERIFLYAEFSQLQHIPHSGYLRQYIQHLLASPPAATKTARPAPTAAITNPVARPQTLASEHTTEALPTHAQAIHKATPKAAVAARPETSIPRNLNPAATPTPTSPLARETRIAKPAPASAREPSRTTSRVSAPPRQATQTQLSNKIPSVQRKPPPPPPNATTPMAFPSSKRQRANTATDTTPRRSATTRPLADSAHPMPGILAVILLLMITGGGIWYALNDGNQAAETTEISVMPSHTTPARSTPTPAVIQTPPPQTQTVAATPITAPATSTQTQTPTAHTDKSPAPATPATTTPKSPGTLANHYHAHIQRKAHEITITLDVPSDDPGLSTTPVTAPAAKTGANISANADKPVSQASSASTATTTAPHPKPNKAQTAANQSVEIIHIVVKGDTLWAIAKRYVKDPFRYPELARLSKIKNPDLIYPGERVRIIKHKRQP